MHSVVLDGRTLSCADVAAIAAGAPATLAPEARARMVVGRRAADAISGPSVLATKQAWLTGQAIPADSPDLVRSWVLGHCAGVGVPMPRIEVRAAIAVRANVLATGRTGCRPELVDALLGLLSADVIPEVPSQGSVGAAGSPQMAHIVRVAAGWGGFATRGGQRIAAAVAMDGLTRLDPDPIEALALINGDSAATALAALAVARSRKLLDAALAACALSFEVVRADLDCLSDEAMQARPHPGAIWVAEQMRSRLAGSQLCASGRSPDPFSIRCVPAVLGAARDALDYVENIVRTELSSTVDNPVVAGHGPIEAGNFHGAPIALALDHLKIALTEIASIAERRVFRLTYGQLSGLPSFLVPGTGLNSGLMLAQYTAASLVSECKGLAHPASVDTIPMVQHREDHVSMAPIAARGALRIAEMVADVVAIELLCAAQGLDLLLDGGGLPSDASRRTHAVVRTRVERWTDDRVLHPDLVALGRAVRSGEISGFASAW